MQQNVWSHPAGLRNLLVSSSAPMLCGDGEEETWSAQPHGASSPKGITRKAELRPNQPMAALINS